MLAEELFGFVEHPKLCLICHVLVLYINYYSDKVNSGTLRTTAFSNSVSPLLHYINSYMLNFEILPSSNVQAA